MFSAVTMKLESRSLMPYLFLLCIWCLVQSGPFVGVNGQNVILMKHSSGDPVEGGMVQLKCDAYGLQPGNVLEWSRLVMNREELIGRNGMSFNATKYSIALFQGGMPARSEILTMNNVSRYDAGNYECRITESDSDSAMTLTFGSYSFRVVYFPAAIYPICFPDGPFTAQNGTKQNMTCATEAGYPTAGIHIVSSGAILFWPYLTLNNVTTALTKLQVHTVINGISFECKISSVAFPGMERSCTIGPITVSTSSGPFTPISTSTTRLTTDELVTTTEQRPSKMTTDSQSTFADDSVTIDMTDESNLDRYTLTPRCHLAPQTPDAVPWIIAGVSLSLLLLSLIIIIFLVFNQRRLKNLIQQGIQTHKADPYMELQPKDDKNKEYMGLDVEATSNEQHTYYQAVESMSKSQPHDFEKVSRKPTTEYEVVGLSM